MDPMELASRIAALNTWIKANVPKTPDDMSPRHQKILRDLSREFQERMYMVMPAGDPCPYCKGSGLDSPP